MKKSTLVKGAAGIYGIAAGLSAWKFFSYAVRRRTVEKWEERREEPGSYLEEIKQKAAWLREQKAEKVTILSFDGLRLRGIFLPAKQKTDRVILAVHGFRVDGFKDFSTLAYFYHQQGYHVLLVDDRAHGESEGKYIGFGCLDREDCYRWVHYLDQRFEGKCTIFLHGVSMGAATVLMTSSMNLPSSVKGIIADCPYTSIWEEFSYLVKREKKPWIFMYPSLRLASKICKWTAGYEFDECSAAEEVKNTKLPILLIHGEDDKFVPPKMSKQIYDNCASKKEIWLVPHARHAECCHVAREEYEKRVQNFMTSCEEQ